MGYFQELDRWLDVIFTDLADNKMSYDEVKRDIRERILDSYRNGQQAAGQSPAERAPQKKGSRRFARRAR